MNALALAALEELKKVDLFGKVGIADTDAATVVASWDEAIHHCSTLEWENFCLEASNLIRDKVRPRYLERYSQWNKINHETKDVVFPVLKAKYESVAKENNLPDTFGNTVEWDTMGYFMELAYLDIAPPGFFHVQWDWYMKGHFPCGWEGEYPAGRPIIY